MKNEYLVIGPDVIIYVERPDGKILEVIIDREELERVQSFPYKWGAKATRNDNRWDICGSYRENGRVKSIRLNKFILNWNISSPVRFKDGNSLNHRKSNLTPEKEHIVRGNKFEIKQDYALLIIKQRDGTMVEAKVDIDDLERIRKAGTWYVNWHKDCNKYFIKTIQAYWKSGKRKRRYISLQNFILGVSQDKSIRYKNKDNFDLRKNNLTTHDQTMVNDYEVRGEITAIFLKRKDGTISETLIDTEDLPRIKALGYTWHWFKTPRGKPYAVGTKIEYVNGKRKKKRIYLHRIIMNAPEGTVVDHIYHKTLDNRKKHLSIVNNSMNLQNREGARKNTISGYRGVSRDNTNKQWIVTVGNKHFGRFKENELPHAIQFAKQKRLELFPYLKKIKDTNSK